jgi:hypothetical protein
MPNNRSKHAHYPHHLLGLEHGRRTPRRYLLRVEADHALDPDPQPEMVSEFLPPVGCDILTGVPADTFLAVNREVCSGVRV